MAATGDRAGPQDGVTDSWLTVPNAFTVLRLLLLAPCCWLIVSGATGWWPLGLLAVWAATDWVDGFLARRLHQVSRLGKTLDPIADRLGISLVVLCLAWVGALSWWAVVIIVVVDAAVLVLAGPAAKRGELAVTWLGKIRTAIMFFAIVGIVAAHTQVLPVGAVSQVLLRIGLALHIVAGASYIIWAQRLRRARR